jgi:hypothetical protein
MPGIILKKGLEKNLIVILAIGIATLAILLYFISRQTAFAGQRASNIQCKQSVKLSVEKGEAWAAPNVDWADLINCPPHYLTLDTDDKDFNKEFVNEIVDCWDKMWEGKLDLFAHETEVFCVVCSVIEDFEGEKQIENTAIQQYMKNNKLPGKDVTVWQYLIGSANDTKFSQINREKPQAIMYVHGKTAYEWSTETAMMEITHQGKWFWPVIKSEVSWLAGWDNAARWDARWAIVDYDSETLRKIGCTVIEQ